MKNTGIYIHVPFCLRKCPYCDFYSVTAKKELTEKYTQAVCRNISAYGDRTIEADTIYFGGGTPSVLSAEQIGRILSCCSESFSLSDPEITIEANPSSVTSDKLKNYRAAGINRISFGVQSAVDSELAFLGRLHNYQKAEQAVLNAYSAGFDNISCDLMLGLAKQTMESLEYSLRRLTELPIKHISAYMLKIEEGTPFDCAKVKNSVADEDLICDMYLRTVSFLSEKGFEQYEISNFAKDGAYSKHNLKYWLCGEYLGFGPSAHSFFGGERYLCPDDVISFINSERQGKTVLETDPDPLEEYIMLGLRLKKGVSFSKIASLSDEKFAEVIRKKSELLHKNGLCVSEEDRLYLTPKGFLVSNDIIGLLLDSQ